MSPEWIETYSDFLLYIDWLEEQGQDTSWRRVIINEDNYLVFLSFYLPDDVLHRYRINLVTFDGNIVEGSHVKSIMRSPFLIELTSNPIVIKQSSVIVGSVLYNHKDLEVSRKRFEQSHEMRFEDEFNLVHILRITDIHEYYRTLNSLAQD